MTRHDWIAKKAPCGAPVAGFIARKVIRFYFEDAEYLASVIEGLTLQEASGVRTLTIDRDEWHEYLPRIHAAGLSVALTD